MQQHIRILFLRGLGAVAFGVGVGRDVEGILSGRPDNVPLDVLGKLRVHLVEHVLAVKQ